MSQPVIIGDATLYLGHAGDFVREVAFDVAVMDPPYGIAEATGGTINNGRRKGDYGETFEDTRPYLRGLIEQAVEPALARCTRAAITPGRRNIWLYPEAAEVGEFYQPAAVSMSTWGRSTWQPILYYGRDPYIGRRIHPLSYRLIEAPEENGHPCPKPLKAWTWLTARVSLPDETVFDPFMGSGTTGVACAKLGRKFIGCEIDPRYFDIACKRIEDAQRQGDMFIEAAA
jgi:DNA modification methylase